MRGIETTKLPVNVILVSDHGMKELTVKEETYIFTDELIDRKNPAVKVANGGTQTHLYVENKNVEDSVYAILKKKEKNYTVLRKTEFPERWQYKNDRVGDLMVIANRDIIFGKGVGKDF